MTRSWKALLQSISLAAILVEVGSALDQVNGPVQLQIIVNGEKLAAVESGEPPIPALPVALSGAKVRVGEVWKTTGAGGDVTVTLDKKKKVRITVSATDYQSSEKTADLTKNPLDTGVKCEANNCSVRIVLAKRQ